MNQSGSRHWEKPGSTCSGPDDGYSTERGAGDCGSSKTESGSKLPRGQLAQDTVCAGIYNQPLNVVLDEAEIESGSLCQAYVNENRVQTERLYSTLQSNRSYHRFSTNTQVYILV